MQLVFILLTFLLLAVAVFALQNAAIVPVRFLHWQVETSVAVLVLSAAALGALTASLLGAAGRLRRRRRTRAEAPAPAPPAPSGPPPGPLP